MKIRLRKETRSDDSIPAKPEQPGEERVSWPPRATQRKFLKTLAVAGIVGAVQTVAAPSRSAEASYYPGSSDWIDKNLGIGTSTPQQNLSVYGGVNVDQADLNNGTVQPGISFGSYSGEGIASRRKSGANQWGLDFYTAFTSRLTITSNGKVGIGTTSPTSTLEIAGPINANGNFGIIFPGTSNWDSLHWNVSNGWLRIGVSGGALRIEGPVGFTHPISVNGTVAIDGSGVAAKAATAYYA